MQRMKVTGVVSELLPFVAKVEAIDFLARHSGKNSERRNKIRERKITNKEPLFLSHSL